MKSCECKDGLTCHECLSDINAENSRLKMEIIQLKAQLWDQYIASRGMPTQGMFR